MGDSSKATPAPRLPLQMEVEYRRSYARQSETGKLKNISLTGAFLEIARELLLSPNEKLTITLNVSGRERVITASVIWNSESGVGVKFHPFNNRDVQIVDDLMYFVESSRENQRHVLDSIFKKVS